MHREEAAREIRKRRCTRRGSWEGRGSGEGVIRQGWRAQDSRGVEVAVTGH